MHSKVKWWGKPRECVGRGGGERPPKAPLPWVRPAPVPHTVYLQLKVAGTGDRSCFDGCMPGGSLLPSCRSLPVPSASWSAGHCTLNFAAAHLQTSYRLMSTGGAVSDALRSLDCWMGKVESSSSSFISSMSRRGGSSGDSSAIISAQLLVVGG